MTDMVDYDARMARSISADDIRTLAAAMTSLQENLAQRNLDSGKIVVLDSTLTYSLGEIWWDPSTNTWLWDHQKYVEA